MNKGAFKLACHNLSLLAELLGCHRVSDHCAELVDDADKPWIWSPKKAAKAFLSAQKDFFAEWGHHAQH